MHQIEVSQADPQQARVCVLSDPVAGPDQVLLAIDRFALTANNVTYAVLGNSFAYWQFFPATEPGWGVVPVWGFATVRASNRPDVAVGERFYGYFPMADLLVVSPGKVDAASLVDASPHRVSLPAVYNHYVRTSADPLYRAADEPLLAVLRPLFTTSYLVADYLVERPDDQLVLSSASSKTAAATAHCLAAAGRAAIGLTSAGNRDFVRRLGVYTEVLAYDEIERVPRVPTSLVDFSGSEPIRRSAHSHLGDSLRLSLAVGGTHWQDFKPASDLPGPAPTVFFAPSQVKKRLADWGPAAYQQRLADAWFGFLARVQGESPWLQLRQHRGPSAALAVWRDYAAGRVDPRSADVCELRSS